MKKIKWFILISLIIGAGAVAAFMLKRGSQPQNFTAEVERGDIRDVVEATGTINAVITVQVGSQVSGRISKLYADFNSRVHKGEIIARIDPALLQGTLLQAEADLQNAKASLVAARANLEKAQAALTQTRADYSRAVDLKKSGVLPQSQLDLATASYDSAKATVSGAIAAVTQAEAQVAQKSAAVSVAQTNLNYTVIRSPIDGTVVARNVDVGQTVAASLQAPTIFTIAQDLTKMQVYASTDESDVGNIEVGREVTFKVDAFPKETFHGVVSQVRMNAITVQNVVTYNTIIDFANPDLKLFPGMTAYVTIPVATAQNVLKLPNTALRYRPPFPPEEVRALYQKYGVSTGDNGVSASGDGPEASQSGAQDSGGARKTARASRAASAVVWKLHPDNTMEPVMVSLGITDHSYTEAAAVLKGQLKEGDQLIIRTTMPKSQEPGSPGVGR